MKTMKIIGVIILFMVILAGFAQLGGWIDVFYTKTVGKAKQNAETEVYYETQSFVSGKKQEALKLYKEYQSGTREEKQAIEQIISHSFADFDENKLNEPLRSFIYNCKY